MSVQVWFVNEEVTVEPGSTVSLSLAVENASDITETYSVVPAGLTAAWLHVTRSTVTLFAGSRDIVEVIVRPPALPTTTSGPTAVAVNVIAHTDTEISAAAETSIVVASFDDRRISALESVKQARRRATYDIMVENHGNSLANCRMHLADPSERIDGTFDPPAVGVAPGGAALVKLRVRAVGGHLRRDRRQLEFDVEAAEPGHDPAVGRAILIQPPTLSTRSLGKLVLAVLVLAGLVASWFLVVRPELRDAAEQAVDDRLVELGSAPAATAPPDDPDDEAGDDAAGDDASGDDAAATLPAPATDDVAGTPVAYRIEVTVGVDNERSEALDLPPDQRFELTDLVLQNPNGDLGRAELRRSGELLYVWNLGAMTSPNEFQPRISPVPFEPGESIVLSSTCDVVGSPTGTGCEVAVLIGGMLYPAS